MHKLPLPTLNSEEPIVKLSKGISHEQRQGQVGEVIAQAFRKLVIKRMKADQNMAAAKLCIEMFDSVPKYVQDVDKRRLNRVIKKLDKDGKKHKIQTIDVGKPSDEPLFNVSDDSPWSIKDEIKLKGDDRPDPAFSIVSLGRTGTWLLDRSASSVDQDDAKAVLKRLDRNGNLVAEKVLHHDVYRESCSISSSNIALMSSDGVLYIYDDTLNPVLETNLREDNRVKEHFKTIETDYWGEFKSQVRAIDISPDGERYLFTLADEAWCCTLQGSAEWGLVMPLKEGWARVVRRSESFGVSQEIEEALRLFGLSLPVNPVEIKKQYHKLALVNHPDRNPNNPQASDKMKAVNHAFEVLTGVDPNTLDFEESDKTYFARTRPDEVIEVAGMRIEMTMTGGSPQDWVYGATYTAVDGGAYVATYSGKVILVSKDGHAERVYDIGTCPYEIVDTGRYAYFLTPTRLYVIEDGNKLAAFLDVYRQGQLVVSQTGFGLLTSKTLKWFTTGGKQVGEVSSRDPIRVLHATEGGIVVQTRQHQAKIEGFMI